MSHSLWPHRVQPPLSMGFSRQEYWSVLPFSSPGDLPDPGVKPWSPALQVDSLLLNYQESPNISWLLLSRFSCVQLCATLSTAAHQAPLSMGFPRKQYWSVLPFSSPGDLPDPGIKLMSSALAGASREAPIYYYHMGNLFGWHAELDKEFPP